MLTADKLKKNQSFHFVLLIHFLEKLKKKLYRRVNI